MGRVLGFDIQLLFSGGIIMLNVLLLCAILYWLLHKPVRKYLDNRAANVRRKMDEASHNLQYSEEIRMHYDKKIHEIEQERQEILSTAHRNAQAKADETIRAAREEADLYKSRAMLDIAREQDRVRDEIRNHVVEISALMAGRFVAANMDAETQNRLLDGAIADLGDLKWQT